MLKRIEATLESAEYSEHVLYLINMMLLPRDTSKMESILPQQPWRDLGGGQEEKEKDGFVCLFLSIAD